MKSNGVNFGRTEYQLLVCQHTPSVWFVSFPFFRRFSATFSATKHLSVFCLMCSCFLDAIQSLLGIKQPAQTYSFSSSPPFSQEKFAGGAATKPPKLENHLNANNARL